MVVELFENGSVLISDPKSGKKFKVNAHPLKSYLTAEPPDGYYVAYKQIALSCILFMFIEMKFIHCHSCVMFEMKSMSMCND